MRSSREFPIIVIVFIVLVAMQACSSGVTAEPTAMLPTDTAVQVVTPGPTMTPTKTPQPTNTPNIVATQKYDDIFSEVERFRDEGLIPDTSGRYFTLRAYNKSLAVIGYLRPDIIYDYFLEYFVFKGDIEWETAIDTSDTSGCGVLFAQRWGRSGEHYYGVFLDKSRIYFAELRSRYYYELGKSRGTGRLHFGNPASADLTLLVYDYKAYVYVDNEFIGEYTLPKDKDLSGRFGYGIISGTNKDYGTHCKINNARIWAIKEITAGMHASKNLGAFRLSEAFCFTDY